MRVLVRATPDRLSRVTTVKHHRFIDGRVVLMDAEGRVIERMPSSKFKRRSRRS